jgi:hypothetical protein
MQTASIRYRIAGRVHSFDDIRTLCLYLLLLTSAAVGQDDPYPRNAVSCERCHSVPSKFGGSSMTVQRMGTLLEGKFIPAPEGRIHHRAGESAQSSALANQINGERISPNNPPRRRGNYSPPTLRPPDAHRKAADSSVPELAVTVFNASFDTGVMISVFARRRFC